MSDDEVALEHCEARRLQAMIDKDRPALELLLDDELTWVHGRGNLENKPVFLDNLCAGKVLYIKLERRDVVLRMFGQTALFTGIIDLEVEVNGARHSLTNRYCDLWVRSEGSWKMTHWQSTLMQAA